MIRNNWLEAAKDAKMRDARRAVIADLCMVSDERRKEREENLKRQAENLARKRLAEEATIRLAGQKQEEIALLKSQLDVLKSSNEELRAANEQIAVTNKELESANEQLKVAKLGSDRAAKSAKRLNFIMLGATLLATLVAVIESKAFENMIQAIGLKW